MLLQSPQTNQTASTSPINPAQKVKVVKGKKNKTVTFTGLGILLAGTGFQVKSWKTTSLKDPLHKNYLVSENSSSINLVEDAAGIAGIKPTQTTCLAIQQPGQRVEFNKEVSSAHIYPSPFSQVTVRGIDWISIMTRLSRFPMKIDLTPVRSATSDSREQMSANATKESTQTRVHSVSAERTHTNINN